MTRGCGMSFILQLILKYIRDAVKSLIRNGELNITAAYTLKISSQQEEPCYFSEQLMLLALVYLVLLICESRQKEWGWHREQWPDSELHDIHLFKFYYFFGLFGSNKHLTWRLMFSLHAVILLPHIYCHVLSLGDWGDYLTSEISSKTALL